MLAHIHPSLQWFACKARPFFNGLVYPGSVSRTIQGPPRAQSPFARWRRYLQRRNVYCIASEGITPPSSLLRTHAPDQNPPLLFGFPIRRVFAVCCQSLLGDGPSRRYLCNPCIGAWTLTPGCLSGASVRFFPESDSLTSVAPSSAHPTTVAMPLQRRPYFRGGSHSVMFRLPCLLALQVAPTAQARSPTGSRDVYTTQWTGSYLPELWYRYMTESDNYHGGTLTRWIAALSAATCNVRVELLRIITPQT
jgi:hypothetical protein